MPITRREMMQGAVYLPLVLSSGSEQQQQQPMEAQLTSTAETYVSIEKYFRDSAFSASSNLLPVALSTKSQSDFVESAAVIRHWLRSKMAIDSYPYNADAATVSPYSGKEIVRIPCADGGMSGLMQLPAGGSKGVAIIIHGMGMSPLEMFNRSNPNSHGIAADIVQRGYTVIAPELVAFSQDRARVDRTAILSGKSLFAYEIAGVIKMIEWAKKTFGQSITIYGISQGGSTVAFTGALCRDVDTCIVSSWFNDRMSKLIGPCSCSRTQSQADENGIFNPSAVAAIPDHILCALTLPRRLVIETGERDTIISANQARGEYKKLGDIANQLGLSSSSELIVHPYTHEMRIEYTGKYFP